MRAFACAWCDWAYMHGHVRRIREETYLSVAEEFVCKFLTAGGAAEAAISSNSTLDALGTPRSASPILSCRAM